MNDQVNGVVIYSPHKKYNRKTYGRAVKLLSQTDGCDSVLVQDEELLPEAIAAFAAKARKVLFLAHDVLPIKVARECAFENVYFFGGQTISKSVQMSLLRKHGIKVPNWLMKPVNIEEIFRLLGEVVVAKPDEYGSFRSKLVQLKRNGEEINNIDRWLYTEYVGETHPPFKKTRVNALFGVPIIAFNLVIHSEEGRIWGLGKNDKIERVVEDGPIQVASKVSEVLSDVFGCGMVGVDMVWRGDEFFVLEANPTTVAISGIFGTRTEYDPALDPGGAVAKACLQKLSVLR